MKTIKENLKYVHLSLILFAGLSLHVFSEEVKEVKKVAPKSFRLSVGTGASFKNNIRKNNQHSGDGGDILFSPLPFVQFSWGPLFIGQQGLTLSLLGDREKSFYVNINTGGDRYDGEGMQPRKSSFFAGGGIKYHKFSFHLARDINGRSHGIKSSFSYAETYTINETFFTRSALGLDCFDRRYADYYYSIRNSEATSMRAEYHPQAYCTMGLSFFPGYKFNPNISTVTGLSLKNVAQTVRQSPTTDGSWLELALILGALWQF